MYIGPIRPISHFSPISIFRASALILEARANSAALLFGSVGKIEKNLLVGKTDSRHYLQAALSATVAQGGTVAAQRTAIRS